VLLERLVHLGLSDPQALPDQTVLLEAMDLLELRDPLVALEQRVPLVPLDRPELLAVLEHRDLQDSREVLDHRVHKDRKAILVGQALLVNPGRQAPLEYKDLRELKVLRDLRDLLVLLDLKDLLGQWGLWDRQERLDLSALPEMPEHRDQMVTLDPMDSLVLTEPPEHQDLLVTQAGLDLKVQQDSLVHPGQMELLALSEALETLEVADRLAPMGSLDLKGLKDQPGCRELQDHPDPADHRGRQVLLDLQDPKVRKVQLVPLVRPVLAGHLDPLASLVPTAHQAFLGHRALQARRARRVLPEIQDLLDLLDPVVLQVVKAPVGLQAWLAAPGVRGAQDLRDQLVHPDLQVSSDSPEELERWDRLVPQDQLEQLDLPVNLVQMDPKDLQDRLEHPVAQDRTVRLVRLVRQDLWVLRELLVSSELRVPREVKECLEGPEIQDH